MPQLVLIGAGRHSKTKMLRALHGHQRRTFYIGELHVQSGKKLPVSVEWAARHFNALVAHIKEGTVLLQYGFDKFVDPEELRVLCRGTAEEQAAYNASALVETKDPERAPEVPEVPEAPETAPTEPPVPEAPEEVPAVPEAAGTTVAGTEATEPVAEPVVEAAPEPESAPVAELAPEPVPEPEPVAVPEPVLEPEPEPAVEHVEAPATSLPEGWRNFNKAKLMELAESMGIDVSDMPSNRKLMERIEKAAP